MSEKEAAGPASGNPDDPSSLSFLREVTLMVTVELGNTELSIDRLMKLDKGSVLEVDKLSEEPLDIRMNGNLTARGEAVIVNEKFGIRVTQIVAPLGEDII